MEVLERAFELTGNFFGGLLRGFERGVTSMFGTSNARMVKKLQGKVLEINALEDDMKALSDEELRGMTVKFRDRLHAGETLDDILVEAFAVCREGGRRFLNMRHYDVQLIGGMVLHGGNIAEMITGEGKTLVATLPTYLNALEGKGVHVVTVNDYLARRDMEWMAPLYMGLGLTVGAIQSDMPVDSRQKAYACDITYGTNNEFGFDYLRDNMRPAARGDDRYPKRMQQSQGELNFAIVDEVDNILIDEARTPLIISGPASDDPDKYRQADKIARQLTKELHFAVNEKEHNVILTDEGVRHAEKLAGVESFYTMGNMHWPHLIDNALKAHWLYQRDVNYVIQPDGREHKIVIVDEFTGRLMDGRQWSDGLHQAVEAKEGVKIKEETQTLATVTLQNFFKLYKKVAGMTGTAMTEATEFYKIYGLDVIAIPPNRTLQRLEHNDVIYASEAEKYKAVADEVERINRWDVIEKKGGEQVWGEIVKEDDNQVEIKVKDEKKTEVVPNDKIESIERKGRPILIGTVSIEKSERVSQMLQRRGVPHQVLNAKNHKREAEIISQAGRINAVTIATNMAGRGTDIILGGNPDTMAWAQLQDKYETRLDVPREEWEALVHEIDQREQMKEQGKLVKELGGLHVIGTERHEARRIDLQLRGRCGRQGDPGSSRFFLALDDDLMRIFAPAWMKRMLEMLGMKEGDAIEHPMVSKRIAQAQKKVEERNFEIRKNLLEYDEVMDEQRKRVYGFRQRILDGDNCRDIVVEMVRKQVDKNVDSFMKKNYGVDSYAVWASKALAAQLEGRDFRGMTAEEADIAARNEAERQRETQVNDAIEENLPGDEEEDSADWNWNALASLCKNRWGFEVHDRELKRVGRRDLSEWLLERCRKAIQSMDLSEGTPLLDEDFALRNMTGWFAHAFDVQVPIDDIRGLEAPAVKKLFVDRAMALYDEKESKFPVLAGMYRWSTPQAGTRGRKLNYDGLFGWAQTRFATTLPADLRDRDGGEIQSTMMAASQAFYEKSKQARKQADDHIAKLFAKAEDDQVAKEVAGEAALKQVAEWVTSELNVPMSADELGRYTRQALEHKLTDLIDEKYRPELRRLERQVLLEIVDSSWKGHLLSMDQLRTAVGLAGYQQLDSKVEYKREGMRTFEEMWSNIDERVTELLFRMEHLDEGFISSTFVETSAVHEEAGAVADMTPESDGSGETSNGANGEKALEPIRNRGARVGRNDPCHCGSGKKYKNCHMRLDGNA